MLFAYPTALRRNASLAADAATDADHPLTNVQSGEPADVALFTTNGALRIVWGWPGSVTIQGVMIVGHALVAGQVVTVQANTTSSWGSPPVSRQLTVLPSYDRNPATVTGDLRGTTLATVGYPYTSILFPATPSPSQVVGEVVWIASWTRMDRPNVGSADPSDVRRFSVNTTAYGVTHRIDRTVRQRRLNLAFDPSAADRARFLRLWREAAGARHGWPCVRNAQRVETEEQFYVTIDPETATEQRERWDNPNGGQVNLQLLELARGLPR